MTKYLVKFYLVLVGLVVVGGRQALDADRLSIWATSKHCLESCPALLGLPTALYKRFKSSIIPNQTGRYMNILNTPKMNGN